MSSNKKICFPCSGQKTTTNVNRHMIIGWRLLEEKKTFVGIKIHFLFIGFVQFNARAVISLSNQNLQSLGLNRQSVILFLKALFSVSFVSSSRDTFTLFSLLSSSLMESIGRVIGSVFSLEIGSSSKSSSVSSVTTC